MSPSTHQNDPQTPQVTWLVVAVVLEDLRRGVVQGEAGRLQELIVWRFEASETKVYDFYLGVLTLVSEEQVLRSNWRHGQQSFLSAQQKLAHSRVYWIGHQDLSDQAHVRVKQLYSCSVEDCRVIMTIRQMKQSSEKHSYSVLKAYDPGCLYSSQEHRLCSNWKLFWIGN